MILKCSYIFMPEKAGIPAKLMHLLLQKIIYVLNMKGSSNVKKYVNAYTWYIEKLRF